MKIKSSSYHQNCNGSRLIPNVIGSLSFGLDDIHFECVWNAKGAQVQIKHQTLPPTLHLRVNARTLPRRTGNIPARWPLKCSIKCPLKLWRSFKPNWGPAVLRLFPRVNQKFASSSLRTRGGNVWWNEMLHTAISAALRQFRGPLKQIPIHWKWLYGSTWSSPSMRGHQPRWPLKWLCANEIRNCARTLNQFNGCKTAVFQTTRDNISNTSLHSSRSH